MSIKKRNFLIRQGAKDFCFLGNDDLSQAQIKKRVRDYEQISFFRQKI
jgi:hypothetical protein